MRRKVLIVDDEPINRRLLGQIISSEYDVMYADNGLQALEMVEQNRKTISLIMLDILMPEMDGYEVLKELQKRGLINRIPVIVLTSEKLAEVKSLELGAADFISKPYDMPEVVLARMRRSIELAESYTLLNKTENDSLTGLYNREFFMQYCKRRDYFDTETKMDAVVVNINKFRIINEMYGRAYSDLILKETASFLGDLSSRLGGMAGRSGADLFYVYVPHCDDPAPYFAELDAHLKQTIPKVSVTFRVGIYSNADHTVDPERRFDRANSACSKKKNSLSTTIGYYDTALHEKELFEERLLTEIDDAIEQNQYQVYYQPKYDVTGEKPKLVSAEALIRWIHPELGLIRPGKFIPLFEENGLIGKLDKFVWNETALTISMLEKKLGKTIPISVNVSRLDISNSDLKAVLTEIVKKYDIEPKLLLLEITESAYTNNSDQMVETVEKLRATGFKVEMDDFGTGYSSLNMLASLPIDALKLDMGFVSRIHESEKDVAMVKLVMEIAKYLGVSVIAEGVETERQYLLLKNSGCDIIQGYYFSRPVPVEVFEEMVRTEV